MQRWAQIATVLCALPVLLCQTVKYQIPVWSTSLKTYVYPYLGKSLSTASGALEVVNTNQSVFFAVDYFKLAAPASDFNLASAPMLPTLVTVAVYHNGLLLGEGDDYTLLSAQPSTPSGWVARLKGATATGDIIQIRYLRPLAP